MGHLSGSIKVHLSVVYPVAIGTYDWNCLEHENRVEKEMEILYIATEYEKKGGMPYIYKSSEFEQKKFYYGIL